MSQLTLISSNKIFGGLQKVFSHQSKELSCITNFAIYLPSESENQKFPVVYYLSGLTCNELNCVQKGGFQRYAAEHGLIVVCPDTSPRNIEPLDSSDFTWDFGYGAGFYVDATEDRFKTNFRMFSYVTKELIDVVTANFNGEYELTIREICSLTSNSYFSRPRQAIDIRTFYGRTRCFGIGTEEPWLVSERVSFRSNFEPDKLSLG